MVRWAWTADFSNESALGNPREFEGTLRQVANGLGIVNILKQWDVATYRWFYFGACNVKNEKKQVEKVLCRIICRLKLLKSHRLCTILWPGPDFSHFSLWCGTRAIIRDILWISSNRLGVIDLFESLRILVLASELDCQLTLLISLANQTVSPLVFNCGTRAGSTGNHPRRFSLFWGENEPGIGVPRFAFPADELAQKIKNQNPKLNFRRAVFAKECS